MRPTAAVRSRLLDRDGQCPLRECSSWRDSNRRIVFWRGCLLSAVLVDEHERVGVGELENGKKNEIQVLEFHHIVQQIATVSKV